MDAKKRICTLCKEEKYVSEFYKNLSGHYTNRCKDCYNKTRRKLKKRKNLDDDDEDGDFWNINDDAIYC
jgi:hypothetical protein